MKKESKEDKESTIVGGNIYLGASIPKLEVKDSKIKCDIDGWAEAVSSVDCSIKYPEYSDKWECYMFGFGDFIWIPLFGNRWVKIKSKGGENVY